MLVIFEEIVTSLHIQNRSACIPFLIFSSRFAFRSWKADVFFKSLRSSMFFLLSLLRSLMVGVERDSEAVGGFAFRCSRFAFFNFFSISNLEHNVTVMIPHHFARKYTNKTEMGDTLCNSAENWRQLATSAFLDQDAASDFHVYGKSIIIPINIPPTQVNYHYY